jgi:hypothetical protein
MYIILGHILIQNPSYIIGIIVSTKKVTEFEIANNSTKCVYDILKQFHVPKYNIQKRRIRFHAKK